MPTYKMCRLIHIKKSEKGSKPRVSPNRQVLMSLINSHQITQNIHRMITRNVASPSSISRAPSSLSDSAQSSNASVEGASRGLLSGFSKTPNSISTLTSQIRNLEQNGESLAIRYRRKMDLLIQKLQSQIGQRHTDNPLRRELTPQSSITHQ